ncbi:MAG: hypothetical protein WCQ64_03535 [Acidobacteriota bacterium]
MDRQPLTRHLARVLLGALLLLAGISHLTFARAEFLAQVPRWVPVDPDLVVVLSGVVEVALGVALIALGRWRVAVGLAAAAFFIAVFPGNVSQYMNHVNAFGLDTDGKRFARLFFQVPLVVWALWCTDASAWLRRR